MRERKILHMWFCCTYLRRAFLNITYTYAHVAFFIAGIRQDVFNEPKLRRSHDTDHQLMHYSVHVRCIQMMCCYLGSPTFIHHKYVT